ncbi:MAG: universal stress protein, partial [Mesorhizobium sp.]
MRFKTIVAILQNEQDAERVLDYALPLAERFESHLVGIHA